MTPTSGTHRGSEQKEEAAEMQRQLYEGSVTTTSAGTLGVQMLNFLMKISQLRLVSESQWAGERSTGRLPPRSDDAPSNLIQTFPLWHFCTHRFAALQGPSEETLLDPGAGGRAKGARKTIEQYFIVSRWLLFAILSRYYVLLKLTILAAMLSWRDYLRSHIEFEVVPHNATMSPSRSCLLQEDIRLTGDNLARFKEYEKLTRWVQFVGARFLSVPGLAALATCLTSSLAIMFYASNVISFRLRRVRVDHLCFIFDPVGERRRMKHELDTIVDKLNGSLANQPVSSNPRRAAASDNHDVVHHRCSSGRLSHMQFADVAQRARYTQLLVLVDRHHLVKPYYLTSEWHRKLVGVIVRLNWLFTVLAYIIPNFMYIGLIVHDLYETTRLRLTELSCRRWNPNGTQMSLPERVVAHLEPLDAQALGAVAYDDDELRDGSFMSLKLWLALKVGAASYFSLKRVAFLLELHFAAALAHLWGSLGGILYISGVLNKIVWLKQLEGEINLAAKESAEHTKRTEDQRRRLIDSENRLLGTLTVAYLHYELFRRQEREFQVFIRWSLMRLVALIATGCSILYLMAQNVKTLNRFVLIYLYFALLSLGNLFMLASSYKAKQVERIKRKMAQIVAYCAASRPLQMSYALELWRRQLEFDEIEPDVFGVHISYGKVITFNAYTIATVLFVNKVMYRNT